MSLPVSPPWKQDTEPLCLNLHILCSKQIIIFLKGRKATRRHSLLRAHALRRAVDRRVCNTMLYTTTYRWIQLESWREVAHWKPWRARTDLGETDDVTF